MKSLLIALLLVFSALAHGSDQSTCGREEGARPYDYCITVDTASRNQDVVYLFHGGGGQATGWPNPAKFSQLKDALRNSQYQMPRVIEVSFGGLWLLAPRTGNLKSGLLEYFTDEVMPKMESHLAGPVVTRKILGFSMGGLNGAILALARPDLFRAAALVSPAFIGLSPFATREEQTAYEQSRGFPSGTVDRLLAAAREYVDSQAEWERVSPSITGPKVAGPGRASFYISAGLKDSYFYEGARLFAHGVYGAGAFTIWDGIPDGDHNTSNPAAIANFLMMPL